MEGLIVALEGPKPICHEEKVVVVFWHPPKAQQAEEFDCWPIQWFVHVTEMGDKSTFLDRLAGSDGNVEDMAEVIATFMSESTELDDSDDNVLQEISESHDFWSSCNKQ